MLKKILFILFLLCMIISCSRESSVLHDNKGDKVKVSQLKGKWIIVNYWAAWCESCLKEIPELNHFYQRNHHKNIVLFGVNYDRLSLNDLRQAIDKSHITFPVILEDPTRIWSLNGIEALPITFIIDPQGKVVKRIVGGNTQQSLLATLRVLQNNATIIN